MSNHPFLVAKDCTVLHFLLSTVMEGRWVSLFFDDRRVRVRWHTFSVDSISTPLQLRSHPRK